ncbi:TraR/DksA C4-type zinc finger protein [Cellulomonas sp.]|uniref:TraR/DksA family transcriptional regulator n=1 Tax=Cellulomonas sp. TaxID=40001 RepID=UPI001B11484C|nr:TraR/DksA C4-type zinc finger protein [Cellulomonas sp.]MBO9554943.1 TraR/DksA C4-type zinc finger protein [Cellulomonas sp.]
MTTDDDARTRLDAERADLEARLADAERAEDDVRGARSDADADDEHDPEGSTLSQQWSHTHGLVVSLRERLTENAAAVARLDDGTYGVCVRCGGPVGEERLAARPSAALCIVCASR